MKPVASTPVDVVEDKLLVLGGIAHVVGARRL